MKFILLIVTTAILLGQSGQQIDVPTPSVCSCAPMPTPEEQLRNTDRAYVGQIIGFEKLAQGIPLTVASSGKEDEWLPDEIRILFRVSESWKGVRDSLVVVRTSFWGPACGYPFASDGEYLVYDYRRGGHYETNDCTRTRPLSQASDDLAYLRGTGK